MTPSTFILIHGAWQGAWAWDTIVPRLEAAGHRTIAVDLPGNGFDKTPPEQVSVDLYAQHVATIIDRTEGPIVLVGHSGGGATAAQTCELRPERVALAIYLCAFLLPDGMSMMMLYERYLEPWMQGATRRVTLTPDGLCSIIGVKSAMEVFYHQSDPAIAEAAAKRLTPQPEGARKSKLHLTPERYGQVPRVYIEARQDRSVHLPLQRQMQALTPCVAVYGLETDHAPQLSAPDALTTLLVKAEAEHARKV